MIRALLRRDHALYMLPFVWGIAAVQGFVIGRAAYEDALLGYTPEAVPAGNTHFVWLLVTTIQIVFVYFGMTRLHEIASPFRMSLPIAARDLWKARMSAILLTAGGAALIDCLFYAVAYKLPLHSLQLTLAFNFVCFTLLFPFLFHSARVRVGNRGMPFVLFGLLIALLVLLFTQVIGMRNVAPGVLCLATTVVLAVSIWRRLPESFELSASPVVSGPDWIARVGSLLAWTDRVPGLRGFVRLDRAVRVEGWLSRPQLLLVLSLSFGVALLAFLRSSLAGVITLVLMQMIWFSRTTAGDARVAHLPIARGRLFLHATLPAIVAALAAVCLFGRLLLEKSWQRLFAGPECALFLLVAALTWYACLSLLLVGRRTPPGRGTNVWARRFARPRIVLPVFWLLALIVLDRSHRVATEGADPSSLLMDLAGRLEFEAAPLWAAAIVVAASLYLALRRDYLNTESLVLQRSP